MEEMRKDRGEGSKSDQTAGITAELPLQNTTTNTTKATGPSITHTDTQDMQDRTQDTQPTDSLEFVVVEGFQVGRGVARVELEYIKRLGCQPGDIVLITAARTTAAKIVPSAVPDRGQQT